MKINKDAFNEYYSVRCIETKQNVFAKLGSSCNTRNFNKQVYPYEKVLELLKTIENCEGIFYQVGTHTNRKYILIGDNEPDWN